MNRPRPVTPIDGYLSIYCGGGHHRACIKCEGCPCHAARAIHPAAAASEPNEALTGAVKALPVRGATPAASPSPVKGSADAVHAPAEQ